MDTYASNRRKAKLNILTFVKACQVGREGGSIPVIGRGITVGS